MAQSELGANLRIVVIDSVENFDKSADHEVHEVRKVSLYPRITEPEVQLVIARWPRYVGFEQGWHHVPDRRELHVGVNHQRSRD